MPELEKEKHYNILFWNCHKKNNEDYFQVFLKDLLSSENVDVFCLAECQDSSQEQINEFILNISPLNKPYQFVGSSDKKKDTQMRVFSLLPSAACSVVKKKQRYINVKLFKKIEIVFIHLKSKISTDLETKIEEDKDVLVDVYKGCNSPKFFMGDFNSSPYSSSLLHSRVFNSIRIGENDVKGARKEMYNHKRRVNPSWNILGKSSFVNTSPLGSFFYTASNFSNIGWELLDQVVFDEELSDFYVEDSFQVLSSNSKNVKLTDVKGRINSDYSDHLPICFSIKGI